MVYSIDNHESFEEVKRLYDQIIETKDNAVATKAVVGRPSTTKPIRDTIPIIVVGNKCDKERQRVVRSEDVRRFVDSHAGVAYVESSAKLNINIEEIFLKLFLMAKLPTEMSPSLHRRVQPNYVSGSGSASTARPRMTIRRRLSDACGTVAPNARRPSIRTDLMILQANQGSIDRLDGPSSRRDSTGSVTSKCEIQ